MGTHTVWAADAVTGQGVVRVQGIALDDLILNFDPESPQERFKAAGIESALIPVSERLPTAVPWPRSAPTAMPLDPAPTAMDDLSRFAGWDAVVVTWTVAEAVALATLYTPHCPLSMWYEYRHGVANYVPLVTGDQAPFNDRRPDQSRYYHSLGLYCPCRIGAARVLLFKSGLPLDYDGPACPVRTLMTELAAVIRPKLFITTGTGGGIGWAVALGDVLLASETRFDCTTQFANEPWAAASYPTAPLPLGVAAAIAPSLLQINARRLPDQPVPAVIRGAGATLVTTDFFGFDDSKDYYRLRGLGQLCDMGDAMVGQALQSCPSELQWYSIRNVSDPQISNPTGDIATAKRIAGAIYTRYAAITSAGSAIATWAVIDRSINASQPAAPRVASA